MTEFGYKRASATGDDLRYRLMQSPTGRQLAIDGNDVGAFVDHDPAVSTEMPPDGTRVFYIRGAVTEQWVFNRTTGWKQI